MGVFPACMSVRHIYGVPVGATKRASDSLRLELQVVVSCPVDTENRNPGPPGEHLVLLTDEPQLQHQERILNHNHTFCKEQCSHVDRFQQEGWSRDPNRGTDA